MGAPLGHEPHVVDGVHGVHAEAEAPVVAQQGVALTVPVVRKALVGNDHKTGTVVLEH